ncbi:hypothetical protein JRI60_23345 [Archangium violaceum]|uniref:hypothetical protein n=1 Tax=Archangium violaceum TaxID=83451 RepID=UPI00194ED85E|nr:hypothetical protein [Archangium violaceum]QRO01749.1 hypothetical protein JRI60_23345 [Archangium violaceum]
MRTLFHKRVVPVVVFLSSMPLLSARAEEKGEEVVNLKKEGAVNFRATLGTISRLYRQMEYEQAFDQIQLARQSPLGTSELAVLSLYEGIVLYDMGKHVESGDAFQMALLIREDARLPEQVAPKIQSHFEAFRRRLQEELTSADEARPAAVKAPSDCPSARIAITGRTLKAQQLWRLAVMERMLCLKGIRGGKVAETLSDLKTRITEAGTGTEWMRVGQEIDRIAHLYAVYPSNEDWRMAKSSVPEELWELGDEEQDVPLPEAPILPVVSLPSQQAPTNLFGCRAAVAVECERLMRRLLLLQNQIPSMKAANRSAARKELFLLGQRVREAGFSDNLAEAAEDIDAWPGKWSEADAAVPAPAGGAPLLNPPGG